MDYIVGQRYNPDNPGHIRCGSKIYLGRTGDFDEFHCNCRQRIRAEVRDTLIRNVAVIDGTGWAPPAGATIGVEIFADHLGFAAEPYVTPTSVVPFSHLKEVQIEHHSKTSTKGGGIIGGGFGLQGAAVGMATADFSTHSPRRPRQQNG